MSHNDELMKAFSVFDEVAQTHGWMADCGSSSEAERAKAMYEAAKAKFLALLAEQPQPAPMQADSRLDELLGQYWDLAYAEGKEGRDADTAVGDAQRVLSEIRALASRAEHAVPDGWKLVPIEPTEKMVEDGWEHTAHPCFSENVADAYRAMLKAAPTSNTGE